MTAKWFNKPKYNNIKSTKYSNKRVLPTGHWVKCSKCGELISNSLVKKNYSVCKCGFHFRLSAKDRIEMLIDEDTFKETFADIETADPLKFSDAKSTYPKKIEAAKKKTNLKEAVITGTGKIDNHDVVGAFMDFNFLGGSMASVVGEKIYRSIRLALKKKTPLITVSCSGGARMHEGILSLMQMAKTSAGLKQLEDAGIPYISVLTDPTTGGVTASFASLGDVIIAEPEALIGFAGPRVIEQTIKQKLPEGFQESEFLREHGFVDIIAPRPELKSTIAGILYFFKN